MYSPICLFTYNRLPETQQTLSALRCNYLAEASDLFIFSDGAKTDEAWVRVQAVREFLRTIDGFKSVQIIEAEQNKGLAQSIISGVTRILSQYDRVIVLEDDLITTPNFLDFMNQALDEFQNEQHIQSISAYSLLLKNIKKEMYFQQRPGSWGWATWSDRWNPDVFNKKRIQNQLTESPGILKRFKQSCGNDIPRMLLGSLMGRNDSWYVRWAFDHFRNNRYSVYPACTYVQNIGFSDSGTHCKGINTYHSVLVNTQKRTYPSVPFSPPDRREHKEFLHYFTRFHKLIERLKLLKTRNGQRLLVQEFNSRIGKVITS